MQELDYITKHTTPNQSGDFKAESITIHWWGEPSHHRSGKIGGVVNWLCQSRAGASAHFVVSGVTGEMAQIVDLDHAAWHAANWTGNHRSIGIEMHPWDSSTPKSQIEADLDAAAYVVALCWHWRPKLKGKALKGHRDWHNTQCPGNYYRELGEIRRRALKIYPRVDPDRPGQLRGAPTTPQPKKDWFDMASLNDLRKAVREESLRGDVVPTPKHVKANPKNPTWTGSNVLKYLMEDTYASKVGLAELRPLVEAIADKLLTPDEIRRAAEKGAKAALDAKITAAEVTLEVKEN